MTRPPTDGTPRIRAGLALVGLAALAQLVRITVRGLSRPLQIDDFIDLHFAWMIRSGRWPWLEHFNPHGSLECWPLVGLIEVTPDPATRIAAATALSLAVWLLSVGLVVMVLARTGHRGGAVLALGWMTGSIVLGQHALDLRGELFSVPLILVAWLLHVSDLRAEMDSPQTGVPAGSLARMGAVGFLVGLTLLMNQKGLITLGAFGLAQLATRPRGASPARAVAIALGAGVPILIFLGILAHGQALEALLTQCFVDPFRVPRPTLIRQRMTSPALWSRLALHNLFFLTALLWGAIDLVRGSGAADSSGPGSILGPLPRDDLERAIHRSGGLITGVSFLIVVTNPFPHFYNFLLVLPLAFVWLAPTGARLLEVCLVRPTRPLHLVLLLGFYGGELALPFQVAAYGGSRAEQVDRLRAVHAQVPPGAYVYDAVGRFDRPNPARTFPLIPITSELRKLGALPSLEEDLTARECRFVYDDVFLDGFLPPEDVSFIRTHYHPIGHGLRRLGVRVTIPEASGPTPFRVTVPGVYGLPGEAPVEGSIRVDGVALGARGGVRLETGLHRIEGPPGRHELVARSPRDG